MANIAKIMELLNCTKECAEQIENTMHQWITPDWSESSKEQLRIDLKVAAECEGIRIIPAAPTDHTKGKIVVSEGVSSRVFLLDSTKDGAIGEVICIDTRREADAQRLAACWNACENIPTESLLESGVASYEQATALVKQRDDLLGALKSFLRAPSVGSDGPGSITIVVQDFNLQAARAIIAKIDAK